MQNTSTLRCGSGAAQEGTAASKEVLQEGLANDRYWQKGYAIHRAPIDDQTPLCVALAETSAGRPIVVPCEGPGYRGLKNTVPSSAVANRPGFREKFYTGLPAYIALGWRPLHYEDELIRA